MWPLLLQQINGLLTAQPVASHHLVPWKSASSMSVFVKSASSSFVSSSFAYLGIALVRLAFVSQLWKDPRFGRRPQ